MRRIILFIIIILFGISQIQLSKRSVWTSFSVNVFSHHDENYKKFYGDFLAAPEIKLSIDFFSGIYLWTDFLLVPASWESTGYGITAKSTQTFLSLGLGDQMRFSDKITGIFDVGFMYIIYKEEVAGESVKGSDFGFILNTGLNYRLLKGVYLTSNISYLKGVSSVGEKEIKLGGLKTSLGIEITIFNKKVE